MRRTCRSHCRACGRHFATDQDFDHHRVGPLPRRRCQDPAQDGWYEVLDGDCRISGASPLPGAVIYRRARPVVDLVVVHQEWRASVPGQPRSAPGPPSWSTGGLYPIHDPS